MCDCASVLRPSLIILLRFQDFSKILEFRNKRFKTVSSKCFSKFCIHQIYISIYKKKKKRKKDPIRWPSAKRRHLHTFLKYFYLYSYSYIYGDEKTNIQNENSSIGIGTFFANYAHKTKQPNSDNRYFM